MGEKATLKYWTNKGYSVEEAKLLRRQNKKIYKEYWLAKGYSEEESIKLSKINDIHSKEYWLAKGYSEEETLYELKSRRKSCHLYWLRKGYSKDEALKNTYDTNAKANKKKIEYWIHKGYSEEEALKFSRQNDPTAEEYWIKRGYSKEDALKLSEDTNPTHTKYWINRGYTEEESTEKIKHIRKCSKEYWLDRGYSEEESTLLADKHARESSRLCKEYWMKKGYTEEESINKATEESNINLTNAHKNFSKKQLKTCKEYWMKKGYTEEESKRLAKEYNRSMTRNIPIEIRRDAAIKGRSKLSKEQIQKSNQKNSQTMKKKDKSFSPIFKEYWLKQGFNLTEAKKRADQIKFSTSRENGTSKLETKCLNELQEYCGIIISRQKYVTIDDEIFCQDGRFENIIFEFNGSKFHLDDRLYDISSTDPYGRTYEEVHNKDLNKLTKYKKNNYRIIIIWEYDYKKNKKKLFKKIKMWLNGTEQILDSKTIL